MSRSLSTAVVTVALGAIIATGIFDGPMSLVSAAQLFQSPARPGLTIIDRSSKGDRLPAMRPDAGTTIILRTQDGPTIGAKERPDPKLAPASLQDCEPVASPYADPLLGRFAGRCFV